MICAEMFVIVFWKYTVDFCILVSTMVVPWYDM